MAYVIRFSPVLLNIFFAAWLITFLFVFLRIKELPARLVRWGLFISLTLYCVRGIIYTIGQYNAWSVNPLSRHLVPPENTAYFFRYVLFHFFSSFFLASIIAVILLGIFWVLQRRSQGKWLDTSERLLVFFGALAAGWPGAILYAGGVFVLPLVATPWLARHVRERRVRLAPFIIVSALLAMTFTPIILPHAPWLEVLVCRTCI